MVRAQQQEPTMNPKSLPHRRHSDELKAQVLHECSQPGACIAEIALSHKLNASLVHKWRSRARRDLAAQQPLAPAPFIALPITPSLHPEPATPAQGDVRIELRRGATTASMHWPVAAAGECIRMLRECLR
jgi:transposase